MKKTSVFLATVITLFCVTGVCSLPANASYIPGGATVTATKNAPLRKGPSASAEKLGTMTAGMSRSVVGASQNEKWVKVKVNGVVGYVAAANLAYKNNTDYDLQTNYPTVEYKTTGGLPAGATIASGGCGPTSVGNVLRNACGIDEATTQTVCRLAISSGARKSSGTEVGELLKAAKSKWGGFTYTYTTSAAEVRNHIANGGMAIAYAPGSKTGSMQSLFSLSGHYISIVGTDKNGDCIVCDPYWYAGKWTDFSVRKTYLTPTGVRGLVTIDPSAMSSALKYYYLISAV